jgi:hypothetical protein
MDSYRSAYRCWKMMDGRATMTMRSSTRVYTHSKSNATNQLQSLQPTLFYLSLCCFATIGMRF